MFPFTTRIRTPLDEEIPWITFKAKEWLDKTLTQQMAIFEWGSGGSTLYYSKRCKTLVSVEHDPVWFERVKKKIKKRTNIIYELVTPGKGHGYLSSDETYKGLSFEKYCKYIHNFPDDSFDLVSVDGRARNDCIRLAMKKVKTGRYLIVDNSERDIYKNGMKLLKGWERYDFFGKGPVNDYPWRTTIFKKPSE